MQKQKLIKIIPDLLVIICCMMSCGLSIIESRLNFDSHHWGLMYANAADLNQGLIPYREIFIQYGFLTTLIQSWSLNIFGNTVVSVGIITGIFYAANIYLSYCLWQKILNKWLSALSVLLMFLIQGYILYPWANYFSYTFLLISLLFLTASSDTKNRYLMSGFFHGLSILARQSVFTLLPIYLYFIIRYIFNKQELQDQQVLRRNIVNFHLGLVGVIGIFLLYLLKESALNDWKLQSFKISEIYVNIFPIYKILRSFTESIIFNSFINHFDGRFLLYSLIFFNNIIICMIICLKIKNKKINLNQTDIILFLFSSLSLFGYLQSIHLYEIFRLQSSSSLGIGLLILGIHKTLFLFNRQKRVVFVIAIIYLFIYLSTTLFFNNSIYYPWNQDLLLSNKINQFRSPEGIVMLEGKLYSPNRRIYYESIAKILNNYSCELKYVVNLTIDSYIPLISPHYQRVQRSPFYFPELLQTIYQDELEKIDQLLTMETAILFTYEPEQIPANYHVVLNIVLQDVVSRTIQQSRNKVYIAVPRKISECVQKQ